MRISDWSSDVCSSDLLSLNFRELRHAGPAVLRLVILGVPIGWGLGTAAAYYGAGLSLPVSAMFGGILVVTGPTVIGPMLRTLRLGQRQENNLKREGIDNETIGGQIVRTQVSNTITNAKSI